MSNSVSAIKKLEFSARKIPGAVSLAQGVPSLPSSKIIREEVIKAIREGKVDKYSAVEGLPELRTLISEQLSQEGINYDPDHEIIVTAGAIESLSATILSLINKGDEVIIPTPTYYSNYKRITEMAGGKPVETILDENKEWGIDIKDLQSKISPQTKAIIVCSPNNPTGSVLSKEELIQLGETAKQNNLILIFDDVYHNLSYGEEVFCLSKQDKFKDNIIRIVSFSKDLSLAGWRIAFLQGPEKLVTKILPQHENLINCAPVVSQYAALAGLKNKEEIVPSNIEEYKKRKELMTNLLSDMPKHLSFVEPKGAYYMFPKIFNMKNSTEFCLNLLHRAKVAAVPGECFGPGGEQHIRLCFGRDPEDIKEGIKRLKKYIRNSRIS